MYIQVLAFRYRIIKINISLVYFALHELGQVIQRPYVSVAHLLRRRLDDETARVLGVALVRDDQFKQVRVHARTARSAGYELYQVEVAEVRRVVQVQPPK